MSSLTRAFIDGVLPQGSALTPAPGDWMDDYLNAMADNLAASKAVGDSLSVILRPWFTPVLAELEIEHGITPSPNLTEYQRRANLFARMYRTPSSTVVGLQAELDAYGFGAGGYGLVVYDNSGSANPAPFTSVVPRIVAGQTVAVAGNSQAFAGFRGTVGTLIVNGTVVVATPDYWGAGMTEMVAGNAKAEAGYYLTQTSLVVNYSVPQDATYWPLFFFIGGAVTYDGTGAIATIANVSVPWSRQSEFIDLVCRIKPMHTWAVAAINWT